MDDSDIIEKICLWFMFVLIAVGITFVCVLLFCTCCKLFADTPALGDGQLNVQNGSRIFRTNPGRN
jgi:hypothetical protein